MIFSRSDSWQMIGQALQGEGGQMWAGGGGGGKGGGGKGGGEGGGGEGGEGGGGEAGFDVDAAHLTVTTPPMAKFCYEIRSDIQNICF